MKTLLTAVAAPIFAVAVAVPNVAAQAQSSPQSTPPGDSAAQSATQGSATTVVGCLYREDQVQGRSPNVAERAGILEDYILVAASPSSDRSGVSAGATGAIGTTASSRMFKVEGIEDDRLKVMVGKRVEVSGRVDSDVEGRRDRSLGPDQINLAEFEAQSIREVAGECPATPKQ
jgi:hypothetical protein